MKRVSMMMLAVAALALGAAAQTTPQQTAPAQQPSTQQPQSEQSKKDAKKDDTGAQDAAFTQSDADEVMGQLREGLQGHSRRMMLDAFDAQKMDGYLAFKDQLEAFFNRYDEFRVNVRVLETSAENGKGVVMATYTVEETPRSGMPTRREGTLRFELERTKKGWKIVDFNPRSFFS